MSTQRINQTVLPVDTFHRFHLMDVKQLVSFLFENPKMNLDMEMYIIYWKICNMFNLLMPLLLVMWLFLL